MVALTRATGAAPLAPVPLLHRMRFWWTLMTQLNSGCLLVFVALPSTVLNTVIVDAINVTTGSPHLVYHVAPIIVVSGHYKSTITKQCNGAACIAEFEIGVHSRRPLIASVMLLIRVVPSFRPSGFPRLPTSTILASGKCDPPSNRPHTDGSSPRHPDPCRHTPVLPSTNDSIRPTPS